VWGRCSAALDRAHPAVAMQRSAIRRRSAAPSDA
jgi:hypothetical protein